VEADVRRERLVVDDAQTRAAGLVNDQARTDMNDRR
jgi:hypothetical protein